MSTDLIGVWIENCGLLTVFQSSVLRHFWKRLIEDCTFGTYSALSGNCQLYPWAPKVRWGSSPSFSGKPPCGITDVAICTLAKKWVSDKFHRCSLSFPGAHGLGQGFQAGKNLFPELHCRNPWTQLLPHSTDILPHSQLKSLSIL